MLPVRNSERPEIARPDNELPRCGDTLKAIRTGAFPRYPASKSKPREEQALKCNKLVDVGRRSFLRGGVLSAAGATAAVVLQPAPANAQAMARVDYPGTKLANLTDLAVNEPMDIAYPDADSPGILLKLGTAVDGGVGPDGDIVAYSVMCPHRGWQLQYNGTDKTLNCPGHYSRFDCEAGGQQVWGHATQNLPQFELAVDDKGDIYASGVDELLYGRLSNVLAV